MVFCEYIRVLEVSDHFENHLAIVLDRIYRNIKLETVFKRCFKNLKNPPRDILKRTRKSLRNDCDEVYLASLQIFSE